jgi:plasmid stabilization system protein ParE
VNILEQGIQRFGPAQATGYMDGIEGVFLPLSEFPRSSPERTDLQWKQRMYPFGAHRAAANQASRMSRSAAARSARSPARWRIAAQVPWRLCGLHSRQPDRVDFGPLRLWWAMAVIL